MKSGFNAGFGRPGIFPMGLPGTSGRKPRENDAHVRAGEPAEKEEARRMGAPLPANFRGREFT